MKRLLALICCCLVAAALSGGDSALAAHHKRAPSNLLVDAQEWSLWPSRTSLPAGTVIVQLWNRGQDQHDLRIRRLNTHGQMVGKVLGAVKITNPGQVSQATWHLKAGHYEIYCSMPGHLKLGMHTRITVTRN